MRQRGGGLEGNRRQEQEIIEMREKKPSTLHGFSHMWNLDLRYILIISIHYIRYKSETIWKEEENQWGTNISEVK